MKLETKFCSSSTKGYFVDQAHNAPPIPNILKCGFKGIYKGCTAKKFFMNELFFNALNLLQNPEKDIQAIAKELHFSSSCYFSKFFKKAYGIPPSEYVSRYIKVQ